MVVCVRVPTFANFLVMANTDEPQNKADAHNGWLNFYPSATLSSNFIEQYPVASTSYFSLLS